MNHAIDWSKPLQTETGLPVKYIRRRANWDPDGPDRGPRCQIAERSGEFNAGCPESFPHVILIDGKTYETCSDSGYTSCQVDYERDGRGHKIINAPGAVPTLDLSKPVQTKDGAKVVILTATAPGPYPVVGYIADEFVLSSHGVIPRTWTIEGRFNNKLKTDTDLVSTPPPMVKRWLNLYRMACGNTYHPSPEEAAISARSNTELGFIKTITVEIPDEA